MLTGGSGRDVFVFDTAVGAVQNRDTVEDFTSVDDGFYLSKTVFTTLNGTNTLTGLGVIDAEQFAFKRANGGLQETDDRIVYGRGTGQIWYDANGGSLTDAVEIALSDPTTTLVRSDLIIIA